MQGSRGLGRRRSLPLVLVLALALGVGACDPGDEPTDPPPTTSSSDEVSTDPTTEPSTEPSTEAPTPPAVEQPTLPAEAGVDDRSGAAAFAEYYFALLDYSFATGDTETLERISSPDCNYCGTRIDAIAEMSADGIWIESPGAELTNIRVQFPESGTTEYVVRFELDVPETVTHQGDGSAQTVEAENFPNVGLGATWMGDRFVVSGVNLDTSS